MLHLITENGSELILTMHQVSLILMKNSFGNQPLLKVMLFQLPLKLVVLFYLLMKPSEIQNPNKLKDKPVTQWLVKDHQEWED